jgi:hypothetical protein
MWHVKGTMMTQLLASISTAVAVVLAGTMTPFAEAGPADLAKLTQAKRDKAAKVYEAIIDSISPKPSGNLQKDTKEVEEVFASLCQWSARWLEAERELNSERAHHAMALKAHLDRMKHLEALAKPLHTAGEISPVAFLKVEYYRLEAELWWTKHEASR